MGRIVPLSGGRRAMAAMLEYARRIPTIPVARPMNLAELAAARQGNARPPSWTAIFMRAYGLTCQSFDGLRRIWLKWPYPRLYEHHHSVCAIAVEREWKGQPEVFFGRIRHPERHSLEYIHNYLIRLQTAEIPKVAAFRGTLRFGRLPRLLQRWVIMWKLDFSGSRHVKYMGTFGMSNYGMLGAESLHPIGPQTTVMTLGPISREGAVTVKMVYDHRVLDGSYVARSLNHLEQVLQTTILGELRQGEQRKNNPCAA